MYNYSTGNASIGDVILGGIGLLPITNGPVTKVAGKKFFPKLFAPRDVAKIKNGPKFPNLKDHARRHSNVNPNSYYNSAVKHTQIGKKFRVRHDGRTKNVFVSRTGSDSFTFTSTSKSGNTIFTHLDNVNTQYLRNKGITLPKDF